MTNNEAARKYHETVSALNAGMITVDEARDRQRVLRESMPAAQWERIRLMALVQFS